MEIKIKKSNNKVATTSVENSKIWIEEDESFSKIGNCLFEKLSFPQTHKQNINIFFSLVNGYARIRKTDLNKPTSKSRLVAGENEEVLAANIPFAHNLICPHSEFSRLPQQFDFKSSAPLVSFAVFGILVDGNGNVLMMKRSLDAKFHPRAWVFPGGIVRKGQAPFETVTEFFKQDLGLTIVNKEITPDIVISDDGEDSEEEEEEEEENDEKQSKQENKQQITFKRKTRLQSKIIDQMSKGELPFQKPSKKQELLTKGTVRLSEFPKIVLSYESVYPTNIRINYPQSCSVEVFYLLQTSEDSKNICLSQNKSDIDYSGWFPLLSLSNILNEKYISGSKYLDSSIEAGLAINHNNFPISLNSLVGVYPNNLGEGLPESNIAVIKLLASKFKLQK